jgi:hypothetical protein
MMAMAVVADIEAVAAAPPVCDGDDAGRRFFFSFFSRRSKNLLQRVGHSTTRLLSEPLFQDLF